MNKKRKLVAVAVLVAMAMVGVTALTLGFLGDKTAITNKFKIGHNKSSVEEDVGDLAQSTGTKYHKKIVKIKNEDNVPCYVRVYMDFSDSTYAKKSSLSNESAETAEAAGALTYYSAERKIDTSDGENTYIEMLAAAANTTAKKWVFIPENDTEDGALLGGYYYYIVPVEPGKSTDSLIQWIKIENEDDANNIKAFNVLVYSETVRAPEKPVKDAEWAALDSEEKKNCLTNARNAWKDFLTVPES